LGLLNLLEWRRRRRRRRFSCPEPTRWNNCINCLSMICTIWRARALCL
jgi:hypothetical protein